MLAVLDGMGVLGVRTNCSVEQAAHLVGMKEAAKSALQHRNTDLQLRSASKGSVVEQRHGLDGAG